MKDRIVHDLSFLCSVCVRSGFSVQQMAVVSSLLRGDTEASEIQARTGIGYTQLYRILNNMKHSGDVVMERRKDDYRRMLRTWHLTTRGKRMVIRFEKAYRAYSEKRIQSALLRSRGGHHE